MARLFLCGFVPPVPTIPHIERPALVERIQAAAERRVCLVVAGPGWGKTTALAAWLAAATEFKPAQLVTVAPGRLSAMLAELAGALLASPEIPRELFATAAGEMAAAGPPEGVVLILDDVPELLGGVASWSHVEELCRYGPRWLHLVLVSRHKPPFSLQRLRGQGLVADIDATDLAFGEAEVAALVAAVPGGNRELAGAVRAATGGWPAAVRMVIDALPGVPATARDGVLRAVVGPGGRLGEYLAEEVLAAEPPSVDDLLHRLAVVSRVTPPLAEALGLGDAVGLLPDLARRGLVEFASGPEPSWSLTPVAREFLLGRPGLSRDERLELHRRAAAFHAGRGAFGVALWHYAAAQDRAAVATLLAEHGTELIETGHVDGVLAAAELAAPPAGDQRVQQALGYARHVRGEWAMALDALDRAGGEELAPGLAWRMGVIRYARGEPDLALALYRRGRLDREDTVDEALLLSWIAAAHHMMGDYGQCQVAVAQAAAAADRCRDARAWASVDAVRMLLAAAVGDRAGADAWYRSALRWAAAADDRLQRLRITVNRAAYLLDAGMLPEALRQVEDALRRNETSGYAMLDAPALTLRGLARAHRGELAAALSDLAAAGQVYQAIGSRLLAQPLVGVGHVHSMRAELAQARAAFEEALAQAEPARAVLSVGAALAGLARVRAADDPAVARALADRAVELAVQPTLVWALVAQGWVALLAGDAALAAANASRAAGISRARRDRPGLAESLELAAMATQVRQEALGQLGEAVQIWAEAGYPVAEARARLVAATLAGDRAAAALAEQSLRGHGVRTDRRHAAGALAVLADSAPSISIRALGAFQVLRNGEPVPAGAWRSKKARSLLKILIARRGRPVAREQLTEVLWPEEDPGAASRRLSVLLSTARGVLGGVNQPPDEGPIVTDRDVVWLDLTRVDVDVEDFLATASAALEAHAHDLPQAIAQLVAAEARYGGEFLAEDPYQEWAAPLRDEAATVYASVLRALVRRLQQVDDVDRSMRYSLLLLQCDRYDESAHLDLVRMLARSGRRGEARRRYREYVRLMSEIGVRPRPFPDDGRPPAQTSGVS